MKHMAYTGRSRLARLEEERARLKDRVSRVDHIIAAIKRQAVADGVAMWTEGNPRELAPNKDWWITNQGIDAWNKFKRLSKPSPVFTWLIS